jgi:hypothetical protein
MSICQHCSGIGYHETYCSRPLYPAPATRIEWFGKLQVHVPVKP